MKIGWLLGWAVPQGWFEPLALSLFPSDTHVLIAAKSDWLSELEAAGPFDWVVGYSLGSLLLLSEPVRASALGKVRLLAPIFGFTSERGLGGRVSRSELLLLIRGLKRDPQSAMAGFYARAGLNAALADWARFEVEPLLWGLEQLDTRQAHPPLPTGWKGWCGSEDPLLDAAMLHSLDSSISVVGAASHHPLALVQAFAQEVPL